MGATHFLHDTERIIRATIVGDVNLIRRPNYPHHISNLMVEGFKGWRFIENADDYRNM